MRIGIVGLGLGGAALGAALAERGIDFSLFEQAGQIKEVGAGITVWPNAIRLLERIGLGPRLAEIGSPLKIEICGRSGEHMQWVRVESELGSTGYNLHRAEFLNAMASLIPSKCLHLGKRCTGIHEDADGVRLSLDDGTSAIFDVVIGADGIKSTLLDSITKTEPPTYSRLAAYRGIVANSPDFDFPHARVWTDHLKYLMIFPVSAGRMLNFVGVVPTVGNPEESWFSTGSREELIAEFADWDARALQVLGEVNAPFRWGLFYRSPLPTIISRRVALLGDAAHSMLIHAGQGANQAVEDAFALAVLLSNCSAKDVPQRLKLYEDLRLERVTAVQEISRRGAQFMHATISLDPGVGRPRQQPDPKWIIDYDVQEEAEKALNGVIW